MIKFKINFSTLNSERVGVPKLKILWMPNTRGV